MIARNIDRHRRHFAALLLVTPLACAPDGSRAPLEEVRSPKVRTSHSDRAPASVPDGEPFREGIWISREEVMKLPREGSAWYHMKAIADRYSGLPSVDEQDQDDDVYTFAKALVYVRTGHEEYRAAVRSSCLAAIDTEQGGQTFALARNLLGYVLAADLVGLEPEEDRRFRAWLRRTLTEDLDGRTLRSTQEERPNSWGTYAGASRAAVAIYLGDRAELDRTARVFKGWLGDRSAYVGFTFGELDWHADEMNPVGINPVGSTKDGESISGVIPDDMRRGGEFRYPPGRTRQPWGALEGATILAEILTRQGYEAWEWQERALLRAVEYLYALAERYPDDHWWAEDDDEWIVWLVNEAYGKSFPARLPAITGKSMGWTDWTHAAWSGVPNP